ncbi:hypothetical protein [Plantactinospora sonchi]|uniref:DUF1963 domain-containing protein n=1 Tax=Plantactinospora sonchi TaxID=1544735 RepID=A0ABU7RPU5_9ACTN
MTRLTTPPPPAGLLDRFPGLAALGRTTTRLHPRPDEYVTSADSHVGGPLRWPAAEPWPTCDVPHQVQTEAPIPAELVERLGSAESSRRLVALGFTGWGSVNGGPVVGYRYEPVPHPRPNPMVPVAQLRAGDIPDLPRPGGADLLQVFWCPFEHAQDGLWGPTVQLRWWREADLTDPVERTSAADPGAEPEVGEEHYLPQPCRLHPEQVVEYPYPEELPADLRERVDDWRVDVTEDVDRNYVATLMAPGWKVGGYPAWNLTDLLPTPCPDCAGPTSLLLVIASSEYDGGTRWRWLPVEERPADGGSPDLDVQEPTGITVGRSGSLRIFACLRCPGTPFRLDQQ